jgi:hypothetical protein
MKNQLRKLGTLAVVAIAFASCDSTPDSVGGTTAPASSPFLYVKSPNAHIGNQCNVWDLTTDVPNAGFTYSTPALLRTDSFAPALLTQTVMTNQCSAYNKMMIQGAKRYVVSSGERVAVYDVTAATTPPPTIFPVSGIQAMEFVNGDFFVIRNNNLKKADVFTMTPISTFTPIALPTTSEKSNLCYSGNYLYVMSGGELFKIDTTGSGSIATGYPITVSTAAVRYEGLEYINTTARPNSLYAIKRSGTANSLVKINPVTGAETIIIPTLSFFSDFSKISSLIDPTTEFYYYDSSNGFSSGTNTLNIVDLTSTSGTYTSFPSTSAPRTTNYLFGLQLKD